MREEPRPIERAGLAQREILGDDQPRRAALGHEARDKREREAHRRRPVAGARRRDLVQGVAGKPAAERAIERAGQRQPWRARRRRRRASLDLGDGAPQTRHPLSPVAARHPIHTLYVRSLF